MAVGAASSHLSSTSPGGTAEERDMVVEERKRHENPKRRRDREKTLSG